MNEMILTFEKDESDRIPEIILEWNPVSTRKNEKPRGQWSKKKHYYIISKEETR